MTLLDIAEIAYDDAKTTYWERVTDFITYSDLTDKQYDMLNDYLEYRDIVEEMHQEVELMEEDDGRI